MARAQASSRAASLLGPKLRADPRAQAAAKALGLVPIDDMNAEFPRRGPARRGQE